MTTYYYAIYLIDDEVKIEFVPHRKAGTYRFEFPKNGNKSILFDQYNNGEGNWKFTHSSDTPPVSSLSTS
ncbi:hypothetical protein [Dyadobacter sp. 676]|uniref:Glycosyl hydrolase family 92 N-terminal domain-containing protein n=1 Tax=Dyadobacter sp. 676 TaxID=3088362 RepID=A0AAU8FVF2_9BACT